MRQLLIVASTLALLVLSGCGVPTSAPTVAAPPSAPAPSATVSAAPTPAATPSVAPANPATEPITGAEAFDLCKDQVSTSIHDSEGGDIAKLRYASLQASTVHARPDGSFYIYIQLDNQNQTTSDTRKIAVICVIGGTPADPVLDMYGTFTRMSTAEIQGQWDDSVNGGE